MTSLRAFVAASGCVARAQVVGTSGDPKLDAAAVRWVLEGAVFSPGTANGAPAAIATMFNVRFKLTD